MGINCEIKLHKSDNGVFRAGSSVKGVIRYVVDEENKFSKITMSLKGKGLLSMTKKRADKSKEVTYWNSEEYLDMKEVISELNGEDVLAIGSYEIPFNFKLPQNIPSSLCYTRNTLAYKIRCRIQYYVVIKFERPSFWKLDKKYKKDIVIESGINAKLSSEPVIYGKQKRLIQLFRNKKSIVNIKACILKSVLSQGGKVQMEYEVNNDTNVAIKAVETRVVEIYTFKTTSHEVKHAVDVPHLQSKTGSIKSNGTQNMTVEFDLPPERRSLDFSNLVRRDYCIVIIAELPFPHFNAVLEIPFQVGESAVDDFLEPPPSYWEAMGEDYKDEYND